MDPNLSDACYSSEKSGVLNPQSPPPPYPGNPIYPGSYPCQPVPPGAYVQAPYPGQSVAAVCLSSGMLQPQAPEYQYSPPVYPPSYPNQSVPQTVYTQGPYPGQSVVAVQPTVYVASAPLTNPVPDYLCYSIFTLLCCFLPLGIAALIYSCATREANFAGQRELAVKNSKTALILNHLSLGIGLLFLIILAVLTSTFVFKDN